MSASPRLIRRVALPALLLVLAAWLFVTSWDDSWSTTAQWLGALGVCGCFVATVLVDQPLPSRRVAYHRVKLVALCCAVFLAMATLPYYIAQDGDPLRVVDPKLLNATGYVALGMPMLLVAGVLVISLDRVAVVSTKANVALLGVVFMFVVIEVFARVTAPSADPFGGSRVWSIPGPGGSPRYVPKPDFTLEFSFPSDPRGYFEEGNVVRHHINSDGYRGPLRAVDKPPDTYRIVVLGDSNAFGWGVLDDDIPGAQLERALGGKVGDHRLEVITFAAPGYTTADERDILDASALAYSPDLVIVWYSINDASPDFDPVAEEDRNRVGPPWYQVASKAVDYFVQTVVGHRINARRNTKTQINEYLHDGPNWQRVKKAMVAIRDLCSSRGAKIAVVIEPTLVDVPRDKYFFAQAHDVISRFCGEIGLPHCDLWPATEGHNLSDLKVHPADAHSNEVTKGMYAVYIADFLNRDVLP